MFFKMLLFSLLPVVSMTSGGLFAFYKKPNENFRSAILHFAAGVIFSIAAVEILPDIMERHLPIEIVIGFGVGVALMFVIENIAEKAKERKAGKTSNMLPLGFIIPVAVDVLIDALLLGIGFAAGETEGVLLAIALSIEFLGLGLALATELKAKGLQQKRLLILLLGMSLLFWIIAVLGGTLLSRLPKEILELLLSFGLAALLYLVTEELLKEAHEVKEQPYMTLSFFVGFIVFVLIGMYV